MVGQGVAAATVAGTAEGRAGLAKDVHSGLAVRLRVVAAVMVVRDHLCGYLACCVMVVLGDHHRHYHGGGVAVRACAARELRPCPC